MRDSGFPVREDTAAEARDSASFSIQPIYVVSGVFMEWNLKCYEGNALKIFLFYFLFFVF